MDYSLNVHVVDPHPFAYQVAHEYGISMSDEPEGGYDAIANAVSHQEYMELSKTAMGTISNGPLLLFDINGLKDSSKFENYWEL